MTEPIIIEFSVACDVAHAFVTWTSGIARWWPTGHTMSGDPGARIVFEPRPGGRILEREPDGTEHLWGRVRHWDPPASVVYTWHLGSDPADATEVTVTFAPEPAGTAVRIEHRGWERFDAERAERRDANVVGWRDVIGPFAVVCDLAGDADPARS